MERSCHRNGLRRCMSTVELTDKLCPSPLSLPLGAGVLTWPSLSICQNSARSLCHVLAYLTQNDLLKYCWVDIPLQATNTSTLLLLSVCGLLDAFGSVHDARI